MIKNNSSNWKLDNCNFKIIPEARVTLNLGPKYKNLPRGAQGIHVRAEEQQYEQTLSDILFLASKEDLNLAKFIPKEEIKTEFWNPGPFCDFLQFSRFSHLIFKIFLKIPDFSLNFHCTFFLKSWISNYFLRNSHCFIVFFLIFKIFILILSIISLSAILNFVKVISFFFSIFLIFFRIFQWFLTVSKYWFFEKL